MRLAAKEGTNEAIGEAETDFFLNIEKRRLEPILDHAQRAAELQVPPKCSFNVKLTGKGLEATWTTSVGNSGLATLESMLAPEWSNAKANTISWVEFRRAVSKLDRTSWIFRGQSAPWSLRTCFHRRGRYDLLRYSVDDIPSIHRLFVAATNYWLDVANPSQHASLIAVAQHNGYPTPLLDWTRSPYIAAFFAVRDAPPKDSKGGPRIHALHAARWRQLGFQTTEITEPVPTLTVLDSVPFWNPRAVQQQSVTTFANIDNIELHVSRTPADPPTMAWYDFDISERESILDELEWMGITESLLFPGMEGGFKTLARRRFPV
jgi:hypothetical protein